MRIVLTVGELLDRGLLWADVCGLVYVDDPLGMSRSDDVTLTAEQAVALGIIEEGERW
jgi:hypothetical protein